MTAEITIAERLRSLIYRRVTQTVERASRHGLTLPLVAIVDSRLWASAGCVDGAVNFVTVGDERVMLKRGGQQSEPVLCCVATGAGDVLGVAA